jgi:hypothetical protein
MPTNQAQDPKMRTVECNGSWTYRQGFFSGLQRGLMVKEHVFCRSRALLIETA